MQLVLKIVLLIFQLTTIVQCECDSGCTNATQEIFTELRNIRDVFKIDSIVNVTSKELANSLNSLTEIVTITLSQQDVLDHIDESAVDKLSVEMMMTLNIILENNIWEDLSLTEQKTSGSQFLEIIEDYSLFLNKENICNNTDGKNVTNSTINIKLWYRTFRSGIDTEIYFQEGDDIITLPFESVLDYATDCPSDNGQIERQIAVSALMIYNLPLSFDGVQVNSPIISITIGNHSKINLNEIYNFTYRINVTEPTNQVQCAYWQDQTSEWSYEGCNYTPESNKTVVVCECDHLESNFAVLKSDQFSTIPPITITTTDNPATTSINEMTTVSSMATSIQSTMTTMGTTTTSTLPSNEIPSTTSTPTEIPNTTIPQTTEPTTTPSPDNTSPNEADSISKDIDNLLTNINTLPEISENIWRESLENLTQFTSRIIQKEIIVQVNLTNAIHMTNSSLEVLNCLIESTHVWENLTDSMKFNSSSNIFKTIGDLSILMNNKQNDTIIVFKHNSIELHSKLFVEELKESIYFEFDDIILDLPFDALNRSSFELFGDNLDQVASSATVVKNFPTYLSFGDMVVNSDVISVKVGPKLGSVQLNKPHKLRFSIKNLESLEFGDKQKCAFWSFALTNFSAQGCEYDLFDSNRSYTVCECDHLTDFLTLTDIRNREVPSLAKSILTYVCSTLSSLFLVCSIYISLKYNRENYTLQEDQFNVKSNRFALSLSISAWLLVSHLLIMFGLDRTEITILCDLNSIVLLFSLLTTFSFMLMFSIHLYICTSQHHLFRYFSFKNFAIVAYSFPTIIMLLSFVLIFAIETPNLADLFNSLSGEYFCWLSSPKYPYHIWIFVGPVTLIISINSCILISILWKVIKNRRQKQDRRTYGNLFTAYILSFNFGIPWILYVLYINEYMAHIFSYVFIVVNGTQGISLFAEQYFLYRAKQKIVDKRRLIRESSDSSKSTYLSSVSK